MYRSYTLRSKVPRDMLSSRVHLGVDPGGIRLKVIKGCVGVNGTDRWADVDNMRTYCAFRSIITLLRII